MNDDVQSVYRVSLQAVYTESQEVILCRLQTAFSALNAGDLWRGFHNQQITTVNISNTGVSLAWSLHRMHPCVDCLQANIKSYLHCPIGHIRLSYEN